MRLFYQKESVARQRPRKLELKKVVVENRKKKIEQVRQAELSGIEPEAGLEPATLRFSYV
jgi:hypothetical protein